MLCCFSFLQMSYCLSIVRIQLQHICSNFKNCSGIFTSEVLQIFLQAYMRPNVMKLGLLWTFPHYFLVYCDINFLSTNFFHWFGVMCFTWLSVWVMLFFSKLHMHHPVGYLTCSVFITDFLISLSSFILIILWYSTVKLLINAPGVYLYIWQKNKAAKLMY